MSGPNMAMQASKDNLGLINSHGRHPGLKAHFHAFDAPIAARRTSPPTRHARTSTTAATRSNSAAAFGLTVATM